MKQFHFYKITNTINNKAYVGYTGQYHATTRWKQHLSLAKRGDSQVLYSAMQKYGIENFTFQVLDTLNLSPEEAIKQETKFIIEHNTLVKNGNGYNVRAIDGVQTDHVKKSRSEHLKAFYANGGVPSMRGKKHSPEAIQKMSETTKAMVTDEQREQMRQMSLKQWQDPISKQRLLDRIQNPAPETRQKMSRAKQGKPTWNTGKTHRSESIERMRAAKTGKKATVETKQKMSVSRSAYLTEERRQQISDQLKGHTRLTVESKNKIGSKNGSKYTYRMTLPDDSPEIVYYLAEFTRTHGIKQATAMAASKTGRTIKSGYKFEIMDANAH